MKTVLPTLGTLFYLFFLILNSENEEIKSHRFFKIKITFNKLECMYLIEKRILCNFFFNTRHIIQFLEPDANYNSKIN